MFLQFDLTIVADNPSQLVARYQQVLAEFRVALAEHPREGELKGDDVAGETDRHLWSLSEYRRRLAGPAAVPEGIRTEQQAMRMAAKEVRRMDDETTDMSGELYE